jgi:hypothetical protein
VAVRRDSEVVRKRITFFDKDLMADSTASGVKIDSLRARKSFDVGIFGQILGRFILNVVVERENRLPGRLDLRRSDRLEPEKKKKEERKKIKSAIRPDQTRTVVVENGGGGVITTRTE